MESRLARTKIIGYVAAGLMITGFVFKMLHLFGAGVIWGSGVLTASFGFTLLLTIDRFSYEQTSGQKLAGVVGYLGAASVLFGFGVRLLHWPIAGHLIATGGFILLIYFILNNTFAKPQPNS